MKKVISILAALSFVAAVSAQKKPAKPAVPAKPAAPAAPAVAAPAAPAAPAKPAAPAVAAPAAPAAAAPAMAKNNSTMQVGVYGGYNIALANSTTSKTTIGTVSTEVTGSSTTNLGGIYGGGDFLMGKDFQYGLGVAYFQTSNLSGATSAILPITAKIRYFVMPSLYVGLNAGYALFIGTSVSGTTYTNIPVGGELGYQIDLDSMVLDLGAQVTYNISSTKFTAGTVTSETTGGTLFVTPYVRLAFKF